jgi:hypothetical protein
MSKQIFLIMVLCAVAAAGTTSTFARKDTKKFTADDYIEIQQLYVRYNMAIDSGDAEGYAATFVKDGSFNNFVGHDALVQFIRGRKDAANIRHWNTNLEITPTAEGANGSVYLLLVDVSQKPPVIQSPSQYEPPPNITAPSLGGGSLIATSNMPIECKALPTQEAKSFSLSGARTWTPISNAPVTVIEALESATFMPVAWRLAMIWDPSCEASPSVPYDWTMTL